MVDIPKLNEREYAMGTTKYLPKYDFKFSHYCSK